MAASVEGAEGQLFPKFPNFTQNYDFSASDKKIYSKTRIFRALTRVKKFFCVKCRIFEYREDLFFKEQYVF